MLSVRDGGNWGRVLGWGEIVSGFEYVEVGVKFCGCVVYIR